MNVPETATEIRAAVASRQISAVDVCRAAIDRIRRLDSGVHAFLHVEEDGALARAERVDRRGSELSRLPLAGVPVALKDNICTAGVRTTAASRLLEHYVPPYSATVVERLESAGAVYVGKTNCDEFAMGSSTEYSAFGPTRNPWASDRSPGGSSGGSAASVAAGMVPVALGSDTGGSIRQPAALCGVVGLKPTYGRVSRYGLIAFGSSLDQIGPFARTARDAATVFAAIAGRDPRDSTSSTTPNADCLAALSGDARGLRVGVPRHLLEEGVEAGVREAFARSLDVLRDAGATITDVRLPHAPLAIPVYYLVANAEASSNLARYDGVRYGSRASGHGTPATLSDVYYKTRALFGAETKRRIMIGTFVLSAGYYDAYYGKAQQVRALIRRDYELAFAAVDLVALPTTPTVAFKLGERTSDPLQMYLSDVFTVAANLAGVPAVSVPCGLSGGLPVGLQLTGRPFDEATLLRTADAIERRAPFPQLTI
ncbi:MAG TPA: Asp-tRNA(Asn)/Glu-tRNA(Gln) amidotransferase subunit GatA [Vicinamibacterales bacterium]|nr:Asp-tRNA(Asn)/Glu-tRNA(Gln) amidotransferase subunit GatA [Vicinamibacterales bacterium]